MQETYQETRHGRTPEGVRLVAMTPGKVRPASAPAEARPRLRGVLHQYSFFVSIAGGAVLLALAPSLQARLSAAIYALSLSGLLGVSALYHRVTWGPRARRWMRRLDHSMIFVLIAGTYTPFAVLVASGTGTVAILAAVWLAALGAAVLQLCWIDAPKAVTVVAALVVSWIVVAATPGLAFQAGVAPLSLILAGGAFYTAGAIVYARRRPDPSPTVFGYHEVFHTLVVIAAAAHFAAIVTLVLSRS